jgi:hypothetical protein
MEKLGPGDTIDDNEVIAVVIKEMATMLSRYNTCREHLGHAYVKFRVKSQREKDILRQSLVLSVQDFL